MLLSSQLFERIVGLPVEPGAKATVLPVGCRRAPERRQVSRVDADEGAFAREHESGAGEPEDVSEGRQERQFQSFQPE